MPILMYHKFPILICQTVIPILKVWLRKPDTPAGVASAIITMVFSVFTCCIGGAVLKRYFPWSIGYKVKED